MIMKFLAIDIGNYSIKFYEATWERRRINILRHEEILLEKALQNAPKVESIDALKRAVVKSFLGNEKYEGKIIFSLPFDLFTTRFIEVPVTNLKKAEAMIPFQLEETLPYSISQVHLVKSFLKAENKTYATVAVSPKNEFSKYFHQLENENIQFL